MESREEIIAARNKRYEKLFAIVKKAVDEVDPEQLLVLGCPKDEYDGESKRIAQELERQGGMSGKIPLTEDGVLNTVAYYMFASFHGADKRVRYDFKCYAEIARKIWTEVCALA